MKVNPYFKIFACLLFVLFAKTAFPQNVGISSSSSFTPDASAALDVSYTSKGLLIPRVALTANNVAGPISSPATSLLVYNTATAGTSPNNVIPGYYYWNGSVWVMLTTSAQAGNFWSTTGNAGTSYPTNYLGTSDNFGLHVKTNSTHRFWVDSLGSVAVGTAPIFSSGNAREKFLVDAGSVNYPTTTGAFNVISGKGYLDGYLQLNIQNTSPTAAASSDIVASNDQASENANYIDMGINSSAYAVGGLLGGPSTAYLLATGNDFAVGNGALNKNLLFFTAGTTSPATNTERMRIDPSGNIGIGTIAPTQKLDITGNLKFSGALMPNNDPGTAGYLLMSGGATNPPIWYNANNSAWTTTGNAGTTAGTNFIGTTDSKDFVVKTNSAERIRVSTLGDVAIGGTAFNSSNPEQLLVDAGGNSTTPATSFNVISGKGYIDKYLQLNIQNTAATANASSDVVASNDQASENANYIDMGINSSAYATGGLLGGANTAYLIATGSDFAIGNGALSKNLLFFTSGTTSPITNTERMRIDPNGNVGINVTTTPTAKLDVEGTIQLGVGGTVFNNLMRGSFTINNTTSFNAADKVTNTVTITGVTAGATVLVNPTTSLPGAIAIASVRVSAANTIVIAFVNTSTTNNTVGQVTFNYTIIQ